MADDSTKKQPWPLQSFVDSSSVVLVEIKEWTMLVECVPEIIRTRRQYPAAPPSFWILFLLCELLCVFRGVFLLVSARGGIALFAMWFFWCFRKVFMYFLQVSIGGWIVVFFLNFLMRAGGVGRRSNNDEGLSLYGFCSDATRNSGWHVALWRRDRAMRKTEEGLKSLRKCEKCWKR